MTKVVILNSGTGSRLGSLTAEQPKCLLPVENDETIISRQLQILARYGLNDILITTGPFAPKIAAHLKRRFERMCINYIHNPLYTTTNYIYSLLLAGEMIDQDLVLMHGDLVFDPVVLEKLLNAGPGDAVLINRHRPLPEKDFKGKLVNGYIRRIGVDLLGPDCVFLMPIYKLTRHTFAAWLAEMKVFAAREQLTVYAEEALNNLLDRLPLYPVELRHEFCAEVDDLADLETVRRYLGAGGRHKQ